MYLLLEIYLRCPTLNIPPAVSTSCSRISRVVAACIADDGAGRLPAETQDRDLRPEIGLQDKGPEFTLP
jgi:hypothetical protein